MDQNSIADFVKGFCPEIKKYEAYYYGYPEIADELCELVLTGEKEPPPASLSSMNWSRSRFRAPETIPSSWTAHSGPVASPGSQR